MKHNQLTVIECFVDGESVESVKHESVPRVDETIEVGAKLDEDDQRLDPKASDYEEWISADYVVVLRGTVDSLDRHYHSAHSREELTAKVHLTDVEALEHDQYWYRDHDHDCL